MRAADAPVLALAGPDFRRVARQKIEASECRRRGRLRAQPRGKPGPAGLEDIEAQYLRRAFAKLYTGEFKRLSPG